MISKEHARLTALSLGVEWSVSWPLLIPLARPARENHSAREPHTQTLRSDYGNVAGPLMKRTLTQL